MSIKKGEVINMTDMDWSGYKEVKAGEKSDTKVSEVTEGKQ
jgi:hypothetical protein